MVALRVSRAGLVQEEIDLLTLASRECRSATPKVSFDGTNFLVVYRDSEIGQPSLVYAMRISPLGEILDPGGFQVSTIGAAQPSVAFDGSRHLVVWRASNLYGPGTEIRASFVAPDGTVSEEFSVHAYEGDLSSPAVVFGATDFLVVWTKNSYAEADVRGARVTPEGAVIDPLGFDVATGPLSEQNPTTSFDGGRFLIAWTRDPSPNSSGADVVAALFEQDGAPTDLEPIMIATGDDNVDPAVAFDGNQHVVAWSLESYDPPSEIRVARVTPLGELLDAPPGITLETTLSRRLLCQPAMARSDSGLLLAWLANEGGSHEAKDLAATVIHSFDP
jgi:hypothetical protein